MEHRTAAAFSIGNINVNINQVVATQGNRAKNLRREEYYRLLA